MNDKLPENAVIMISPPLKGYIPNDVREWLSHNNTENGLAEAFANVSNLVGWLGHELCDPDNPYIAKTEEAYKEWDVLETALRDRIFTVLQEENASGKYNHMISIQGGWHYVVLPFMERNGYRDGCGWWVK